MKKIEELCINPHPWSAEVNDNGQLMIYDANGHEIGQVFLCDGDATLMRSAPEMYKCLYEAVRGYYWSHGGGGVEYRITNEKVRRWKEVLSKASESSLGEDECLTAQKK